MCRLALAVFINGNQLLQLKKANPPPPPGRDICDGRMNHFCEWPIAVLQMNLDEPSTGDFFPPAILLLINNRRKRKLFYHHWALIHYTYFFACMFKFSSAVLCSVRRKRKLFYHHWAAHSFPPKINFPSDGSGSCFTTIGRLIVFWGPPHHSS